MSNHPDLNDLQFYAMVVEHGGFAAAERAGMRTMREDGQRLITSGVTSVEEVLSVTRE